MIDKILKLVIEGNLEEILAEKVRLLSSALAEDNRGNYDHG